MASPDSRQKVGDCLEKGQDITGFSGIGYMYLFGENCQEFGIIREETKEFRQDTNSYHATYNINATINPKNIFVEIHLVNTQDPDLYELVKDHKVTVALYQQTLHLTVHNAAKPNNLHSKYMLTVKCSNKDNSFQLPCGHGICPGCKDEFGMAHTRKVTILSFGKPTLAARVLKIKPFGLGNPDRVILIR
jgi:hypothetical protein